MDSPPPGIFARNERFTHERLTGAPARGLDAITTLRHFAIVTYAVEPERLAAHLPERFEPDCITNAQGLSRALISVVPFLDVDFHLAWAPVPKQCFGQTNYRAYVRDRETGERVAWFFGTSLDSLTVHFLRLAWRLPWYPGKIRFECEYSAAEGRYSRYSMDTESAWAPAELELSDTGEKVRALEGFRDLEHGLVLLTHPLRGFFRRLDRRVGTYSVWHDRLDPTVGRVESARFRLLEDLELVPLSKQSAAHSVLLQHETDFRVYLPPKAVPERESS